ncbi:MAG: FAD-binding oxidoreductase [Rhodospirillaceae bacterium]
MTGIDAKTLEGTSTTLPSEDIDHLRAGLRGQILTGEDPDYEGCRQVWNAMIDRRPGLIVRCMGVADVLACVAFGRAKNLLTAVRGGGHNIAGSAVCDGGLLIDLSLMRGVRVNPWDRTAVVEPGALLADFDHEAQTFGLATPLGINSTTGVAGLTLGGGFGWLSRKHGLTIDNLLSVDVVTAAGELVHADERDHADLFWAVRGGGGNLGIVTSFTYRLHQVGPEVTAGLIVYPYDNAGQILRGYRGLCAQASEDLACWSVLRKAPPLPFLPEAVHGTEVVVLALCHIGGQDAAQRDIAPLMELGTPAGVHVGPMPFAAWQKAFDPLLAPGARNYWKSHNFAALDDRAIDVLVDYAGRLPTAQSEIFLGHLGGATNRVAADATAYPHRDAEFVLNVHTRWDAAADDGRCVDWARAFFRDTAPYATGGAYVNFITDDEDRVAAAYGTNLQRLMEVKQAYDPTNFFRMNQNVTRRQAAA